jgi:alkanesulfonate monooxygenase SsuD/methylene tetrahydromethanopterin reductase-like flavin-dependent oxidoreductase (luciferase family)
MTSLSILDLVRVTQDTDARGAFDNARDLAAHAERWGYRRFWSPSITTCRASPAPPPLWF